MMDSSTSSLHGEQTVAQVLAAVAPLSSSTTASMNPAPRRVTITLQESGFNPYQEFSETNERVYRYKVSLMARDQDSQPFAH